MRLKATITDAGPYLLKKSEMRTIGRNAIEAAGKLWHYVFKRFHFSLEAFQRYKYKQRSRTWEAIKKRMHPEAGGRPLVFTGESEQQAMANNKVTARAIDFSRYWADVIVTAPKLNFHPWSMTVTTKDEDKAMEDKFSEVFIDGVADAWKSRGLSAAKIELGRGQLQAAG